jgi:hypothetical protein
MAKRLLIRPQAREGRERPSKCRGRVSSYGIPFGRACSLERFVSDKRVSTSRILQILPKFVILSAANWFANPNQENNGSVARVTESCTGFGNRS